MRIERKKYMPICEQTIKGFHDSPNALKELKKKNNKDGLIKAVIL